MPSAEERAREAWNALAADGNAIEILAGHFRAAERAAYEREPSEAMVNAAISSMPYPIEIDMEDPAAFKRMIRAIFAAALASPEPDETSPAKSETP